MRRYWRRAYWSRPSPGDGLLAVCMGLLVIVAVTALVIRYPWAAIGVAMFAAAWAVHEYTSRPSRRARAKMRAEAEAQRMREAGFPESVIASWTTPPD